MSETVQYLTDEAGRKTAVVLPIADYQKLLEDLDDLFCIAERRDEPSIPHDQFKAELKRDGILWHSMAQFDQEGSSEASTPRGRAHRI